MITCDAVVEVLRFVIVELPRRDDLAGHRRLRIVVAEDAALDLARIRHGGLDDDLSVEAAGQRPSLRGARRRSFAFEMPTLDPRFAGFTNIGNRSAVSRLRERSAAVAAPSRCAGRRDRGRREGRARRRPPS